jgi:hypothetical protein
MAVSALGCDILQSAVTLVITCLTTGVRNPYCTIARPKAATHRT